MTDTVITQTPSESLAGQNAPFDREALFTRSLNGLARLERMYDTARKQIERARRAEDFIAHLIGGKRKLIQKLLGLWYTPDDLADVLLEEIGDIPVERKKVVAAIQKCRSDAAVAGDDISGKKRRGRPPRSAQAGTPEGTQAPEIISAAAENSAEITEKSAHVSVGNSAADAGNSPKMSVEFPVNFSGSSEKTSVSDAKTRTEMPSSGEKKDSPERQQRFRRKAPTWVAEYGDHPQYGPIVIRQDGETDADYFWRMWHTAPPWAGEQPRHEGDTETQWIQKCWLLTSPEERAAHLASLPTTAR